MVVSCVFFRVSVGGQEELCQSRRRPSASDEELRRSRIGIHWMWRVVFSDPRRLQKFVPMSVAVEAGSCPSPPPDRGWTHSPGCACRAHPRAGRLTIQVQSTLSKRIMLDKNNRFIRIKFLAPTDFVWEIRITSSLELFLWIPLSHPPIFLWSGRCTLLSGSFSSARALNLSGYKWKE